MLTRVHLFALNRNPPVPVHHTGVGNTSRGLGFGRGTAVDGLVNCLVVRLLARTAVGRGLGRTVGHSLGRTVGRIVDHLVVLHVVLGRLEDRNVKRETAARSDNPMGFLFEDY